MSENLIPVSTLFIGLNGLIALGLAAIVVMERIKTRIWHGEAKADVITQPDPLVNPTTWVATVEKVSQRLLTDQTIDQSVLQRKVRAHANFAEYVPLALLLLIGLELMQAPSQLLWLLGVTLTAARLIYAYGVTTRYGPSIGRAIGFFGTCFVYIVGSLGCIYYALLRL